MFDVSIMHVMDRNLADMANLCGHMDKLYEYLNNELSIKGFEDTVHRFFKGKWFRLKHLFTKKASGLAQLAWSLINGKGSLNIG